MAGYLTLDEFKLRTAMPGGDVDVVELSEPGHVLAQLDDWSAEINDRLRKRYAVPFAHPEPRIILRWLTAIVTPSVYRKRGGNPNDPTLALYEKDRADALAELREAADAKDGLFELPLREDLPGSKAVTKGPMGSSEASPHTWTSVQAEAVNRGG